MSLITLLELIPVVLAIYTWGSQFSNKKLIKHVDNEALVSVIKKQTSKSKNVMTLVRNLVLCLLQNNTTFRSEHVPGSSNKIADSISRKQWSQFRTLAPDADEFYLRLCGVRHMVKDHSDSERENPLPPHGLYFSINSKGYFICTIPQTG